MTAALVRKRNATPPVAQHAAATPAATATLPISRSDQAPLAPAMPEAIPLGQLLRQAGAVVRVGMPDAVWVVASVSAVKPARGGCSIELVEPEVARAEAGILRCYMPDPVSAALAQRIGLAITVGDLVGMTITVRVAVELSPRWGLSGRVHALAPGLEASLARRALDAAIIRLRREGLLDRQARLGTPRDVTRVAVVHPAGAAGWADIAADLARWAAAGLVVTRSIPTPFEGAMAATEIAEALRRAAQPIAGHGPDLVLLVRGGGAAATLGALDTEIVARAIAASPAPVVTGLGHAVNATLADRLAWRFADTPSKALGLVRELLAAPTRRARADHAAVLSLVTVGLDREEPRLAAMERQVSAEALRQLVEASAAFDRAWSLVCAAAEAARGRLARLTDGVERHAADVEIAAPALLDRRASEFRGIMATIAARARQASHGAEDGDRILALVAARAAALLGTAEAELATIRRDVPATIGTRADRAAANIAALATAVRALARQRLDRADDGARRLALIAGAVAEAHRSQEAAIARHAQTIETAVTRRLDQTAAALARDEATLDAADPMVVLTRGYALVTDPSGRPVHIGRGRSRVRDTAHPFRGRHDHHPCGAFPTQFRSVK